MLKRWWKKIKRWFKKKFLRILKKQIFIKKKYVMQSVFKKYLLHEFWLSVCNFLIKFTAMYFKKVRILFRLFFKNKKRNAFFWSFLRFTFFVKNAFCLYSWRFGCSFWRVSGTRDTILLVFKGPGNGFEFGWILAPPLGHPGISITRLGEW